MRVILKIENDMSGWDKFFKFININEFIPLWEILNVPDIFIENPVKIQEISNSFLGRETGILDLPTVSPKELNSHLESIKMIHLGYLYKAFGLISFNYGITNAFLLQEIAERNFVHEKSTFWWQWYYLFKYRIKKDAKLVELLNKSQHKGLLKIINNYTSIFEKKRFFAQETISKVSKSEIFVEDFELILDQQCAYQVWQHVNKSLDKENITIKNKWGENETKILGYAKSLRKMKAYCLSV